MDPYRPPQSGMELAQKGTATADDPFHGMAWEIGTVINVAVERFKENAGVLLGLGAAAFGVNFGMSFVSQIVLALLEPGSNAYFAVFSVIQLISIVLQTAVTLGVIKVAISVARNEEASVADMLKVLPVLVPGMLASLLVGMGTMVGFMLLIVPGFLWLAATLFSLYGIVDKELGVIDGIKHSLAVTEGELGKLLLWTFVAGLLMVALTVFTCGFGMLVANPLMFVANALIYDNMARRKGLA
ncbi:MAG: hypothetical protein VX899_19930 [Myxococcota bacterium]|nr:hypothetical protein [Myxococcota bacterium]